MGQPKALLAWVTRPVEFWILEIPLILPSKLGSNEIPLPIKTLSLIKRMELHQMQVMILESTVMGRKVEIFAFILAKVPTSGKHAPQAILPQPVFGIILSQFGTRTVKLIVRSISMGLKMKDQLPVQLAMSAV